MRTWQTRIVHICKTAGWWQGRHSAWWPSWSTIWDAMERKLEIAAIPTKLEVLSRDPEGQVLHLST